MRTLRENGVSATAYEVSPGNHCLEEFVRHPPDFAVLCVTEEVPIQGALDMLGIPYNGSGPMASAMSLDKVITRDALARFGITTPRYALLRNVKSRPAVEVIRARREAAELVFPMIVKPRAAGCSLGVELVESDEGAARATLAAAEYSSDVLLEEYVDGVEITLGVVGETMLAPIAIGPRGNLYRAADKWRNASTDCSPTYSQLSGDDTVLDEFTQLVSQTRQALSAENAWRLDAVLTDDAVYVLEVNTLPKLAAPFGEMAWAAASSGVSHYELLTMIIDDSLTHPQPSKPRI
jgi:D-alanine-D-alanine ligase